MTATAQSLSADAQTLIDARLDTIDHMLLGKIPRADRLIIVDEVRNQIEEMLARRDGTPNYPEAVIEVLRQLDPPEAYLAGLPVTPTPQEKPAKVPEPDNREPTTQPASRLDRMALPTGFGSVFTSLALAPLLLVMAIRLDSILVFCCFFYRRLFLASS